VASFEQAPKSRKAKAVLFAETAPVRVRAISNEHIVIEEEYESLKRAYRKLDVVIKKIKYKRTSSEPRLLSQENLERTIRIYSNVDAPHRKKISQMREPVHSKNKRKERDEDVYQSQPITNQPTVRKSRKL
jgi:hypothetical protein